MPELDTLFSCGGPLLLATGSVYAGAFGSLPNPPRHSVAGDTQDAQDEDEEIERLTSEDAWLFPVIGSVALFGLYLVIKFFGKEWINWFLGWYFSVIGVGSIWKTSISLTRYIVGDSRWRQFRATSIVFQKGPRIFLQVSLRTPSLILLPVACLPSAYYFFFPTEHRSVVVTNVLALSFAFNALSLLKLDSFKTGTILLAGLFLYDVWWVFGTEVMVHVATNIDAPIKILWPRSATLSPSKGYAMLGLGDIVIPGTFISLALRYDHFRHARTSASDNQGFPKPYFHTTLAAYVLGLVMTMVVMTVFRAAQPALLYLSPACTLSFALVAWLHDDLKTAWAWTDDPEELKRLHGDSTQVKAAENDSGEVAADGIDDSAVTLENEKDDSTKEKQS